MRIPDTAPTQLILSQGLPDEAGTARLRHDLPAHEWHWITRLHRPDDRRRSLVGRALVRRLLGQRLGCAPDAVRLESGPHGKPRLMQDAATAMPAWHFNLAHSGDQVLVGIGPQPLGVDVEQCPDQVDAALWRQVTGLEASAAPPDPRAFCADWVCREAVLKACGLGLSLEPGRLQLAAPDEAGWRPVADQAGIQGLRVRLLWSTPDSCAALCLPGDTASVHTWTLTTQALSSWVDAPDPAALAGRPG